MKKTTDPDFEEKMMKLKMFETIKFDWNGSDYFMRVHCGFVYHTCNGCCFIPD